MSTHGRIIRPRQLFPEFYAIWVQFRRGLLRLFWWFGGIDLWMPPWATAAATGTAAIMLSILLFFLRGPGVSASPVAVKDEVVAPREIVKLIHVPVPTPVVEATAPRLQSRLVRTKLDEVWNQEETATIISRPDLLDPAWRTMNPGEEDPWKIAIPCRERSEELLSYVLRGAQISFAPNIVSTSNVPHPNVSSQGNRVTGLFAEKILPGTAGNTNTPYSYDIIVRNPTTQSIDGVVVRELMSAVERVISVAPVAAVQGNELVWSLGTVPPGDERKLTVTVVPQNETSIETQVTLTAVSQFASASTRVKSAIVPMVLDILEPAVPLESTRPAPESVATPDPVPQPEPVLEPKPAPGKPILKLSATPVSTLKSGDDLQVVFTVTNVGTAAADQVDLFVILSDHLKHRYGKHVKHSISKLNPGDTHQAILRASATKSGDAFFKTFLTMSGKEQEQRATSLKITTPPKKPAPAPSHQCRPMAAYRPAGPYSPDPAGLPPLGYYGYYGPAEIEAAMMTPHWTGFGFMY